jgi:hypothetical protein
MCMAGGIFTEEKCSVCGGRMKDNGKAVACPDHPRQRAASLKVKLVLNGKTVQRRFKEYDQARRFLTGLRFKVDEGTFDSRDYNRENPLGFANLAEQWLAFKKEQIKRHSWDGLNNFMRKAIGVWGNRSIKEIGYAEIEDFLFKTGMCQ